MGNIGFPRMKVISIFDIKGSKTNRRVADSRLSTPLDLQTGTVYKDLDFEKFI